jgi:site-specific DNA recombinase
MAEQSNRNRHRETVASSRVRCAIYTRKSTEEGLEQEFNSLHAQREAAEAYIQSQKHMGWVQLPQHYDDGGFSGGSLERPGLQQLLIDIEAGRVDCVVVYKVDRLSRSLLDFARLMDRFDQRSVSFVSVTQQFNTTSSLGRLTLNILLSFAQFERELIGERTRDKMGAARRKGKWVGGTPVLGYDVDPRGGRLVVNDNEARRVREIFAFYRKHRSLTVLVGEATRHNWSTKAWKSRRGVRHRGRPFTKASLRLLLTNAVYAGKVNYRGVIYEGEHPAIVDAELWEAVNAEFCDRQRPKSDSARSSQNALLAGLLVCKRCNCPMVATYAANKGRRYRYYVCQAARQKGWQSCPTKSVSATLIEDSIIAQLGDQLRLDDTRFQLQISDSQLLGFLEGESRALVQTLVEKIEYDGTTGTVSVTLRALEDSRIEVQP